MHYGIPCFAHVVHGLEPILRNGKHARNLLDQPLRARIRPTPPSSRVLPVSPKLGLELGKQTDDVCSLHALKESSDVNRTDIAVCEDVRIRRNAILQMGSCKPAGPVLVLDSGYPVEDVHPWDVLAS